VSCTLPSAAWQVDTCVHQIPSFRSPGPCVRGENGRVRLSPCRAGRRHTVPEKRARAFGHVDPPAQRQMCRGRPIRLRSGQAFDVCPMARRAISSAPAARCASRGDASTPASRVGTRPGATNGFAGFDPRTGRLATNAGLKGRHRPQRYLVVARIDVRP
jgi:hypothetical protein